MDSPDKSFVWCVALIILSVFLFEGKPDIHDALRSKLTESCVLPIVHEGESND